MADILIKGGTVLDPASGTETERDVYFEDGVLSEAEPREGVLVIDATNAFVAPGFVDLHTHVFNHSMFTNSRVSADRIGVRQGVACVVDAGSSGAITIDAFPENVHQTQATQVFAFINIGSPGLPHLGVGHASRPDLLDLDGVVKAFDRHADWLVGVKVLASQSHTGAFGLEAVKIARKAASLVNKPLMLHVGNAPPLIDDVLDLLRPGDIVTHTYHGKIGGVLGYRDEVIAPFKEAVKRGVVVDLGHGRSSFSFRVFETAMEQGMPLHCISSDLHQGNVDRYAVSLARTMTKVRSLGFSLPEVVSRVSNLPAAAIGIDQYGFGSLVPGLATTASIFREREGEVELEDAEGSIRQSRSFIEPIGCVVNGEFFSVQEPL
ncbi:MAG: amidohydrolase/deacetylase family metallohydrolase [Pseudomonadales bacterium]|nr:amidohydrolase/deacetylase family metallohydrolase [Pseudomonadales bacterium]